MQILQLHQHCKHHLHLNQAVQPPIPPSQPTPRKPIQQVHVPQFSWSHFKPEFVGKPDEDAEAHLLRTNDWMDTYAFEENVQS